MTRPEDVLQQVREQLEVYESLLRAQSDMGEGVAIVALSTGRFRYVNEAFCEIFGYTEKELLELSDVLELAAPEVRPELTERLTRRRSLEDVPDHYETVGVHKDGRRFDMEVAVKLVGEGPSADVVTIVRDVSERRRAEAELARMYGREREARFASELAKREIESFTRSVSHDLSEPLLALLGYVDLLERDHRGSLEPEARMYLERIGDNARYMHALIDDLLELSRVGRVRTETEAVALDDLIRSLADEIRVTSGGADIHVDSLPVIEMNAVRARQLFGNLLRNAVEHCGRPDVHISVRAEVRPSGSVEISVSDDGRGIDARYLARVFGAFERLGGRDASQGTGMGLTICRKIVESIGGRIWATRAERGATIVVEVPAGAVLSPAPTAASGP